VCFLHLQDGGDLVIGVIERLAENICGAFSGREFLEEQQDCKLECLAALCTYFGIGAGVHRFGKPSPDVAFAARVGGLGQIDVRFVDCHRIHTSCTTSSASAALPSMRYAMPNSRGRTGAKAERPSSHSPVSTSRKGGGAGGRGFPAVAIFDLLCTEVTSRMESGIYGAISSRTNRGWMPHLPDG